LFKNKTQQNTLKTVEQHGVRGEMWGRVIEGVRMNIKYNIATGEIPRQNPSEQRTDTEVMKIGK
jgi:hypothetical protein